VKVLHLSPTTFDPGGQVGGGERYVYALARAMAARAEVTLVAFGPHRMVRRDGPLVVEQLAGGLLARWHPLATNPVRCRLVRRLRHADVIHVHQVFTFLTAFAVWLGARWRKPTFVTDLGGGHPYAPVNYVALLPRAEGLLLLSEYSRSLWARQPASRRPVRLEVISGGVDIERFTPGPGRRMGRVLFVGRLAPHKGLEYLIDAVAPPFSLTIVGPVVDREYAAALRRRAEGRPVTFAGAVDDGRLVEEYRTAMVTVLPSVFVSAGGERTVVPELLGLVVLESMACGTPVIVTRVASLPELVEDGVTGFVVPPNDPGAIRDRLEYLSAHPEAVERMGRLARERVAREFTWDAVAERCLRAYGAPARPSSALAGTSGGGR